MHQCKGSVGNTFSHQTRLYMNICYQITYLFSASETISIMIKHFTGCNVGRPESTKRSSLIPLAGLCVYSFISVWWRILAEEDKYLEIPPSSSVDGSSYNPADIYIGNATYGINEDSSEDNWTGCLSGAAAKTLLSFPCLVRADRAS